MSETATAPDALDVMDPANGQCIAIWNGTSRCPNAATQESMATCRCGHLAGGPCCARCGDTIRQMMAAGTAHCFRCLNDGRDPHTCPTRELP